ncbi:hypothetical protein AAC387_Pa05g1376 [Persea americana]
MSLCPTEAETGAIEISGSSLLTLLQCIWILEVLQNDGTVGRSGNDFPLYCGVIVAPKGKHWWYCSAVFSSAPKFASAALWFAFVPANEEGPAVVLDAEVMMKNKGLLLERVADDCRFAAFWISRQSIQLVSLNATTDALRNGILIFCSLKESSIATPQKSRGQGRSKKEDLGGKRGVNTNYLNYK